MQRLLVCAMSLSTAFLTGCIPYTLPDSFFQETLGQTYEVRGVVTPSTLLLSDGRTVRLYGVTVPDRCADDMLSWLQDEAVGNEVRAYYVSSGPGSCGYYLESTNPAQLLNATAISKGLALYSGRYRDIDYTDLPRRERNMIDAEAFARSSRAGIWGKMEPPEVEALRETVQPESGP